MFGKKKESLSGKSDRELLEMQVELLQKKTQYLNSIEGHLIFYSLIIVVGFVIYLFN